MTLLFAICGLVLVGALFAGQWRIVSRAFHQGEAGLGRLAFVRKDAPFGFWAMLALELLGLVALFAYLVSTLTMIAAK